MGEARIGVAVCDPDGIVCSPRPALVRTDASSDIASIIEIARAEDASAIVVGLPLNMSGRRGPAARAVLGLCSALRAKTDLPVEMWDERLSTVEASARLREAGASPSRDRGRLDSASAALILEAYLAARINAASSRRKRREE